MMDLVDMLGDSLRIALPEVSLRRTAGWDFRGYYLSDTHLWSGIYYRDPLIVVFATHGKEAPEFARSFHLDKSHFFAFSKDEQFEAMVEFVRNAHQEAPAE